MAGGLEGVRVIELAQALAVPLAGRLLADFGADVVHIEHPVKGDVARQWGLTRDGPVGGSDKAPRWEHLNRNKKGMTLDVSQQGGQQVLYRMVKKADFFISNMRPYEIERYHLDYDTLSKVNPRIIVANLTGVGKKGPQRNLPAYDHTIYWARAGFAHRLAPKGQVLTVTGSGGFGDAIASVVLAYGLMTALYVREKTGVGQEVDVSLLGVGIFHRGYELISAYNNRQDPQLGERTESGALGNCYRTKDSRWLRLGFVTPDRFWSRFCKAIEREDLEHDPRFETTADKSKNSVVLISILDEVFAGKTLEEWKARLPDDFPWAPVQNVPEIYNDPQARANGVFTTYDHPAYGPIEEMANPVFLSKTPAEIRMPAPEHGQHTEEVLLGYDYTWEDIAKLKEQGIIP